MKPVYDVDGIQIWHADCNDVLPTVDPASVGLLLTDPPYGIGYTGVAAVSSLAAMSQTAGMTVVGDDEPFDPSHLLAYPRAAIWGYNNYANMPAGGAVVWDKTGGGKARTFMADAELMWHNLGTGVDVYHHLWLGAFRESEHQLRGIHPTQKPVSLMRWIVEKWTEPGDLILDPYMGSGPVARACADLGRRYIGVEIVEEYVDAAISRLGQTAMIFDQ